MDNRWDIQKEKQQEYESLHTTTPQWTSLAFVKVFSRDEQHTHAFRVHGDHSPGIAGGPVKWFSHLGKQMDSFFKKLSINLPYSPAI